MTGAVIQKVCGLCGQDCANRPRTKDQRGRYFCSECYNRAIAKKRQLRGTPAVSQSSPPGPQAQPIREAAIPVAARSPEPIPPPQALARPAPSTPTAPLAPPPLPTLATPLLPPALAPSIGIEVNSIDAEFVAPNGSVELAPPKSETVEDSSAAAGDALRATDAAEEVFEIKEAPRIDAQLPAAMNADAQPIELTETEDVSALSVDPAPPPQAPEFDRAAPQDLGVEFAVAAPDPEHEPETAAVGASAMKSPAHDAQAMTPSSIAPMVADDEPDDAEPSAFELEPEDQQQEWLDADSNEPAYDEPLVEASAADAPEILAPAASHAASRSGIIASDVQPPPALSPRMLALHAGSVPAAFAACRHCHRPMPTGAVVCLACGFNTMSGERSDDDVERAVSRRRPRSGWAGPILMAIALTLLACGGVYLLLGTQAGVLAYGVALLISVPTWFAWALIDAGDTEGAQLKIWLVPGYVFAWVYGESRSRYLRAATAVLAIVAIAFAALTYQWRQQERQHTRSIIDQRANANMPD